MDIMVTGTARTIILIATMGTERTGRITDTGHTGITRITIMAAAFTDVAFMAIARIIGASIDSDWRLTRMRYPAAG
jgi:hypothetical protein